MEIISGKRDNENDEMLFADWELSSLHDVDGAVERERWEMEGGAERDGGWRVGQRVGGHVRVKGGVGKDGRWAEKDGRWEIEGGYRVGVYGEWEMEMKGGN